MEFISKVTRESLTQMTYWKFKAVSQASLLHSNMKHSHNDQMNGKKYEWMTVNLQSMIDLLKDCHNLFITSFIEIPMELLIFNILFSFLCFIVLLYLRETFLEPKFKRRIKFIAQF